LDENFLTAHVMSRDSMAARYLSSKPVTWPDLMAAFAAIHKLSMNQGSP